MSGIAGSYDGEGPNVSGALAVNISPDAAATGPNPTTNGQGKVVIGTLDRRRRLRVSTEGARDAVAISVGGGDQILTKYARGVYIGTAGNLVVRLADAAADTTFSNLAAGVWYPFCVSVVRQTGSTAAGVLLF